MCGKCYGEGSLKGVADNKKTSGPYRINPKGEPGKGSAAGPAWATKPYHDHDHDQASGYRSHRGWNKVRNEDWKFSDLIISRALERAQKS